VGKGEPTGLGDILSTMRATTSLGLHLEHAQIWERWAEVAGPTVSQHVRPVTVRDGELVVEADSAVWMHKVNYKRWQIVRHINKMAKKELVHGVFVILRDGDWDEDDPES
jgi:predicted nucleic acid-binding Zn ribbon protein